MLVQVAYAASEGGIGALGFDAQALVFQIINFGILLFVLRFIAYKPLLKVLESRRQKIEEGLRNHSEVEKMKEAVKEERMHILKDAQKEVQKLILQTREQAEGIIHSAQQKAHEQSTHILNKARVQAEQELHTLHEQFKKEAVSLVVTATEQVLGKKIDSTADAELINQAITKAEQELVS